MALLIDSNTPVLWRSPHALQIGVERDVVLFEPLSALDESLIAALRRGVSAGGLEFIARAAGGSTADAARVTSLLAGHLAVSIARDSAGAAGERSVGAGSARIRATGDRILIDGCGPAVVDIARALRGAGIPLDIFDENHAPRGLPAEAPDPDLVIIIDRFVLPPARYREWLSRDVAHLPVLFGERTVTIGPLVRPGHGPCLYCLDLAHTEVDSCWPVLATQLAGSPARSESPISALAIAARLALWLAGPHRQRVQRFAARSLRIDTITGQVSRERHRPHARCACQSLPENASAPAANVATNPVPTS